MKTKEFLPFYLTDLDAVARHFEEKAAEGLMLKSFSNTSEYEPCEPKKLRFNVVLCPVKGSENEKINDGSRDFIGLVRRLAGASSIIAALSTSSAAKTRTSPI